MVNIRPARGLSPILGTPQVSIFSIFRKMGGGRGLFLSFSYIDIKNRRLLSSSFFLGNHQNFTLPRSELANSSKKCHSRAFDGEHRSGN